MIKGKSMIEIVKIIAMMTLLVMMTMMIRNIEFSQWFKGYERFFGFRNVHAKSQKAGMISVKIC